MTQGWRFFIDRGGTFTDVVALAPDGTRRVAKVLSQDEQGVDPTVRAIRGLARETAVLGVRMGTTVATNALLERRGEPTCLAITKGFGDALDIGLQDRPELFTLRIEKPAPLHARVLEVDERVLPDGTIERAPSPSAVLAGLRAARAAGCRSLAVVFVHGFAFPEHELLVGRLAVEAGFEHVSLSHEVAPEPGLVARGETTEADAYLTPVLARHVQGLRAELGQAVELRCMQSSGGLVRAEDFRGRDALLSGPAGGAVAVAAVAREAGLEAAIGIDMGGTSTDVTRWSARDGLTRVTGRRIAGVRVHVPALDVVTVAAGGGSVLSASARRLAVGPESAGAHPGPACYRAGGPPTVTDANVVLGRIQPRWFPACFGPGRDLPLDAAASQLRLEQLAAAAGLSAREAAAGFVRIANETMAAAIREVSVARGHDVRDHALVAFGGAAAQHACALADVLGMTSVLLHPLAGVLSAHGMGLADAERQGAEAVLAPLADTTLRDVRPRLMALEQRLTAALQAEGLQPWRLRALWTLDLRVQAADHALRVPLEREREVTPAQLLQDFHREHERVFGFRRADASVEVATLRVEVAGSLEGAVESQLTPQVGEAVPVATVAAWFELTRSGERRLEQLDVPVHRRQDLGAGCVLRGPAIVTEDVSTIVIEPGWRGTVGRTGLLQLERAAVAAVEVVPTARDPVRLELFANRFASVADQMGETLRRLSQSPNMKERLDYSCALFTPDGRLVANAPHVPVHLGAMGATVRALLDSRGEGGFEEGLALVSNDPYRGGSHLPDVTVVTPVFAPSGRLAAFVACRGHHADIGGIRPGSMPPSSTRLDEEGVLLHDVVLARSGRVLRAELSALLLAPPWPVRDLQTVLADLESQVAANALGARQLVELMAATGEDVVAAYMSHVLDDAAEATRELILRLPQGPCAFEDALDDGTRIRVTVSRAQDRLTVDFTGTAPQHPGNLNAPRAVTTAVVLYVLRSLVGRRIPLNAGCLEPVRILIPEGSLLAPRPPAAVAGGNVETSMRLADILLAALGALAGSQGTMNNVTFGDASFGTYETLGGGAGAGPDFPGASAVHSHLTNTRLTDVELLERRCPVLVRELSIRRGSGGRGRQPGGDGLVRALEFRQPVHVAVLSERRTQGPRGLCGGGDGQPGRNRLLRRNGDCVDLGGRGEAEASQGDVLIIETPGGGAFGAAEPALDEDSSYTLVP